MPLGAPPEQRLPLGPEPALEVGQERERVGREDPVDARDVAADDPDALDAGAHGARVSRRTVASIRPCGSLVATKISPRFTPPNGSRSTTQ